MSSPLTRRQLATALASAAAAAAQAPATTPAPPAADLESAREQLKKNREAIAKVKLTETLEPALTFRP